MSTKNNFVANEKKVSFESFIRTVGISKPGSLSLGFVLTLLVLLSELSSEKTTVLILLSSIALLIVVFLLAILTALWRKVENPGVGSWGVVALFFLGSALGVLAYHARADIGVYWARYISLGGLSDVIFAALFVFGVVMAVFVVRVWNKQQDDFMKSVATALGGAAIPPLLGKTITVDASQAFAAYFAGFALSVAINVIYCARLIGIYSTTRSIDSRTKLAFLYGGDKADAVDERFLKNFEQDPVYARRLLVNAVLEYQKRVRREFAAKMEERRKKLEQSSPPNPLRYYHLLSIECEKEEPEPGSPPQGNLASPPQTAEDDPDNTLYTVVFREITTADKITEDMFRISVSVKLQDNLEYIGAPGAYRKSFSFFSSVAGLALFVRQTIVMDRDKLKRFRTSEYPAGLCPADIEQPRGLDEIDFLSYIAIPVASDLGQREETPLGILHVDTKLFAAYGDIPGMVGDTTPVYRAIVRRSDLTKLANNLYDRDDAGVKYLEEMRAALVPILDLYLRCRLGST